MPLSNSQYDAIIREYHAKQIKNQHMVDNRMKEVYGKDPRLKAIDNAISSCSLVQARRLLGGDVTALQSCGASFRILNNSVWTFSTSLDIPNNIWSLLMNARTARIPATSTMNAVTALNSVPLTWFIHSQIYATF